MIISWILSAFWSFISFVLRFLPEIPGIENFSVIGDYIAYVANHGAKIFFLFVPYNAAMVALDVVTFFWIYEPLSMFIM